MISEAMGQVDLGEDDYEVIDLDEGEKFEGIGKKGGGDG